MSPAGRSRFTFHVWKNSCETKPRKLAYELSEVNAEGRVDMIVEFRCSVAPLIPGCACTRNTYRW